MAKDTRKTPQQPAQPDWRGKVYDADTHQWTDAPAPAAELPAPAPAPEQE